MNSRIVSWADEPVFLFVMRGHNDTGSNWLACVRHTNAPPKGGG